MIAQCINYSMLVLSAVALMLGLASSRNLDEYSYYDVQDAPIFLPTENNYTLGPGDRAILKCRVENLGTKTVTWRKEGEQHPLTIGLFPFVSDTRISVDHNYRTHEWTLIIDAVRPEDEGVYHCTVATKEAVDNTYEITLNVKTVRVSGVKFIERSQPIRLTCNATGRPDPPHNVDWYKDGIKIESNTENNIIITKKIETKMLISVLVKERSQLSDSGDYVCRSSDKENASIHIHILDVANSNVKRESDDPQHADAQRVQSSSSTAHTNIFLSILTIFYTILNHSRTLRS